MFPIFGMQSSNQPIQIPRQTPREVEFLEFFRESFGGWTGGMLGDDEFGDGFVGYAEVVGEFGG